MPFPAKLPSSHTSLHSRRGAVSLSAAPPGAWGEWGGGRAGGQGHGMVAGSATSKALMGSERDKKLSVTEAHAAQGSSEASIMVHAELQSHSFQVLGRA